MTPDTFWKIVDKSARADDPEESLRASLARLSPEEIAAFDKTFYDFVDRAMTWDMWGAAYLAMGGCSEDGFEYARRGIVARGRKLYERVLENPDALARLEDPEDIENEEIGYIASEVYEEKTGKALPRLKRRAKPAGRQWDFEDNRACAKRLPKLFAKMGGGGDEGDGASDDAARAPSPEAARAANRQLFDTMVLSAWKQEETDIDAAIEGYLAALAFIGDDETSPLFPLAHRNLAFHYGNRRQAKLARPHVEVALRTRSRLEDEQWTPYLARVEAGAAWFFFKNDPHRIEEALALVRSAQRQPGIERDALIDALDTEMRILVKLGREKEARAVAKRGLALDPKDKDFQKVAKPRRV